MCMYVFARRHCATAAGCPCVCKDAVGMFDIMGTIAKQARTAS